MFLEVKHAFQGMFISLVAQGNVKLKHLNILSRLKGKVFRLSGEKLLPTSNWIPQGWNPLARVYMKVLLITSMPFKAVSPNRSPLFSKKLKDSQLKQKTQNHHSNQKLTS